MPEPLAVFFGAWAEMPDEERSATLASCLAPDAVYADPRSGAPLTGIEKIAAYVGQFSANAPGWTAAVVSSDTHFDVTRALISFQGPGPNGQEMTQHGTYFVDHAATGMLSRLVGFVGKEPPA
ncbi:MAG: nuclear transport factor 2 family protein [Pseudomonadota bacterium]